MNKEAKKDKKKKKKAMVATWSNSDPSTSDGELEVKVKANLCLMANDDEVYDDQFDDYDTCKMSMNTCLTILKNLGIDAKISKR